MLISSEFEYAERKKNGKESMSKGKETTKHVVYRGKCPSVE